MFGKEYAHHLNILTDSFGAMNQLYQKKVNENKKNTFIERLRKLYISIFGIPEIGFQIRGVYFKNMLTHIFSEPPKRILDAGCGIGTYTLWLSNTFPETTITGGDIDKNKLKTCIVMQNELHKKNIQYIFLDVTKKTTLPKFDLIVIIDVLEHIDKYKTALKNLSTLLNKNGHIFIHVPQPKQKRIFSALQSWEHEDHIHKGITKKTLENKLKKLRFNIVESQETFGFFGKLSWELNHLALSKSFLLAGLLFPFLYLIARMDILTTNKHGLGIAILAKKSK